jgi:hypothetical protein
MTRREAAKELRLNEAMLTRYEATERLKPVERRRDIPGRGNGVVFYSVADVKRLRRDLLKEWGEGGGPPQHLVERWPSLTQRRWIGRWNGHLGAADGIDAGRAKGGRPSTITPEQAVEILRLDKEGLSVRLIAAEVLGDARLKNRVHRFLQR